MARHFNERQLCRLLDSGEGELIKWCQDHGLILKSKSCRKCEVKCRMEFRKQGHSIWVCTANKKSHRWTESVMKNTVFEKSKFGLERVLSFFYSFAHGETEYRRLIHETSAETKTSTSTTADWLMFSREICFVWLDIQMEQQTFDGKIGGEGVTVQIDETKIGKRKYNKGRLVEGHWLLGMVEILENGVRKGGTIRLEICPDNVRNADTLIPLIQKHVRVGTTIVSDGWAAYSTLTELGYIHSVVIHEENYVDPETGANTQCIESQWRALKRRLLRGGIRGEENFAMHLCEYLWRREILHSGQDPFFSFIEAARIVYNPLHTDDLWIAEIE